jgi:hypothetical protein
MFDYPVFRFLAFWIFGFFALVAARILQDYQSQIKISRRNQSSRGQIILKNMKVKI